VGRLRKRLHRIGSLSTCISLCSHSSLHIHSNHPHILIRSSRSRTRSSRSRTRSSSLCTRSSRSRTRSSSLCTRSSRSRTRSSLHIHSNHPHILSLHQQLIRLRRLPLHPLQSLPTGRDSGEALHQMQQMFGTSRLPPHPLHPPLLMGSDEAQPRKRSPLPTAPSSSTAHLLRDLPRPSLPNALAPPEVAAPSSLTNHCLLPSPPRLGSANTSRAVTPPRHPNLDAPPRSTRHPLPPPVLAASKSSGATNPNAPLAAVEPSPLTPPTGNLALGKYKNPGHLHLYLPLVLPLAAAEPSPLTLPLLAPRLLLLRPPPLRSPSTLPRLLPRLPLPLSLRSLLPPPMPPR
jgi:hypothetical protein